MRLRECTIGLALALALPQSAALAQPRHPRRHPAHVTTPPVEPLPEARAIPTEPAHANAPTPEAMEVARQAFREAVAHFEQGQWDAARAGFYTALRLHPTPLVRFNLALACRNGSHLVDALQHYREFLRETVADPAMGERRAAADREVTYILAHVSWLQVDASGDTPVRFELDGGEQPLDLLGREFPVEPGDHTLRVEGQARNVQEAHGSFYEGEHVRVPVTLSTERPTTVAAGATWSSQPLSMAHWTLQPGPGGRWIDWSTMDLSAPSSLWDDHPFTLALLGSGGAVVGTAGHIVGTAGVSARYFPRSWMGIEATGEINSTYGPGGGLYALLRFPLRAPSVTALGLRVGAAANASALTVTCASCNGLTSPNALTVTAIWLDMAFTSEWRLRPRLPLRLVVGVRVLANAADFRGAADHGVYNGCNASGACDLYSEGASGAPTTAVPYVSLDLGYAL